MDMRKLPREVRAVLKKKQTISLEGAKLEESNSVHGLELLLLKGAARTCLGLDTFGPLWPTFCHMLHTFPCR